MDRSLWSDEMGAAFTRSRMSARLRMGVNWAGWVVVGGGCLAIFDV